MIANKEDIDQTVFEYFIFDKYVWSCIILDYMTNKKTDLLVGSKTLVDTEPQTNM